MREPVVKALMLGRARRQGGVLAWLDGVEEGATQRVMAGLVRDGALRRPWAGV